MTRVFCLFCLILIVCSPSVRAGLTADLSSHLVTVRSDFVGENLVLFGALDTPLGAQDSLTITVRGPEEGLMLRRKKRVYGLWINRQKMRFRSVPAFYRWYLAGGSETAVLDETQRLRHQLGVKSLTFLPDGSPKLEARFRDALLEERQRTGLYVDTPEPITFISPTLFRAEVTFPQRVPVGAYQVDVTLFAAGKDPAAITTPLVVAKDGIGADVAWYARRQPLWYGMIAVILALGLGALANVIFSKLPKKV